MDGQICKRSRLDDVDRISSLPGDLKSKILVLLPIEEAVKTSCLSSKWRYEWASIPDLVFNHIFCFTNAHMLTSLVDMVLMLHQGPICKFQLVLPQQCIAALGRWILFLSRNGIQQIKITPPSLYCGSLWKMPFTFFTVQSLKDVQLQKCILKLPQTFNGLKNLNSLELKSCSISDHDLGILISSCPNLENFMWNSYSDVIGIALNAPKLRKLAIIGFKLSYFYLLTPSLAEAILLFSRWSEQERICKKNFTDLLDSLSKTESLELLGPWMQHLALGLNLEPSFKFYHLTKLTLIFNLEKQTLAAAAFSLFQKVPNLETLSIILHTSFSGEQPSLPITFWESATANILFQKLRFVSIDCRRKGKSEHDLILVKVLLATAPVLVSLHLKNVDAGVAFYKKLVRFKRASKEAEILVD